MLKKRLVWRGGVSKVGWKQECGGSVCVCVCVCTHAQLTGMSGGGWAGLCVSYTEIIETDDDDNDDNVVAYTHTYTYKRTATVHTCHDRCAYIT